ncbi:PAS domain S-box protein [Fulvivirga ligni]|uniref:PAS domain S-box protein n=1 Tax=Fulvivirga ligni TaxID=2904246 RepID=UPI001F2397CF|nr:PAS domain S-box protein [Fulvivirga ligni]UII20864.1 PAS domain S-box protein [Fulvivirga ligni]
MSKKHQFNVLSITALLTSIVYSVTFLHTRTYVNIDDNIKVDLTSISQSIFRLQQTQIGIANNEKENKEVMDDLQFVRDRLEPLLRIDLEGINTRWNNLVKESLKIIKNAELNRYQENFDEEAINESLFTLVEYLKQSEEIIQKQEELNDSQFQTWSTIAFISGLVFLLVSCYLGYKLYASLDKKISLYLKKEKNESNRIKELTAYVETISQGNYDTEIETSSQNDQLTASLLRMKEQLAINHEESEKRNWLNTGLASFGQLLRSENNLNELTQTIINEISKYLNVNQGFLFIKEGNENDTYLELKAAYAYERKKFLNKRIEKGQGLAGQSWIEGRSIYMIDVPSDYVNITSGLGQATPNCIFIVPLKLKDEVYGVIELASFHKLQNHELELLEKLAESIAGTIASAQINETTKALLNSTQKQTELLSSQEEELRQNMEELQATQEEMERKASEIESRMIAVDESGIASIEFDLSGNIITANQNFLSLMGYNLQEIQGRHHRLFVSDNYRQTDEYKQFWKDLRSGITKAGEYERYSKTGQKVFIQGSYSILRDNSGAPKSILKLATDITAFKLMNEELQHQAEEMKAQEEELRQNMEELSATQEEISRRSSEIESRMIAVNESGVASIEFDLRGNIITANENFLQLMGYTLNEVQLRHHEIFVSETYAKSTEYKIFWKELGEGKNKAGEYERYTKSGKRVYIQGSYSIIRNSAGEPQSILKLATDITAFKLANEDLQQNMEELSATQDEVERILQEVQGNELYLKEVLNVIPEPFYTMDTEGIIKLFNQPFKEGLAQHNIHVESGMSYFDLQSNDEFKEKIKAVIDKVKGGEKFQYQLRYEKKGGDIYIQNYYTPIKNMKGDIQGIAVYSKDITQIRRLNEN